MLSNGWDLFSGVLRHCIWLMGPLQSIMVVRLFLIIAIQVIGRALDLEVSVQIVGCELLFFDFLFVTRFELHGSGLTFMLFL